MQSMDIKRTLFSVADFLDWQRQGTLDLTPPFQRRSVWRPGAKSYLIDTVVRGLPTPLLFLRDRIDLETLRPKREVIDGQQRLRTLLAFIDEDVLPDFDAERDRFVVRKDHNPRLTGKSFAQLDGQTKDAILRYEFSTHVLPRSTDDRDILMIFARLNSTGTPLNFQELRNAQYFGTFKSTMYQLAYEQLERWLQWKLFTPDDVSRMAEVEMTSDLVGNMIGGLSSKSQAKLRNWYEQWDDSFPGVDEVVRRFRETMDAIDQLIGAKVAQTVYRSDVYFFTLFTYLYEVTYGLGSGLERRKARALPSGLNRCLLSVSEAFRWQRVPDEVLDAVQRASTDLGRRRTRLDYLKDSCGGKAS